MSYKPVHGECDKVALITTEPTKHTQAATSVPRMPRHSIAISLTLAVVSYCCCSALGIIPIIMVVFAYVKREHGKAEEATRMSNYSRVVSGIVIALAVFLLFLSVLWLIGTAFMKYRSYGDDVMYPDYYYPDDVMYPDGLDPYDTTYTDDVTDQIYQVEDIIEDFVDEETTQYDDVSLDYLPDGYEY